MKAKLLLSALLFSAATILPARADVVTVRSPDGHLSAGVFINVSGRLEYRVERGSTPVLLPSPIGVRLDGTDLSQDALVSQFQTYRVHETYPWRGVKARATNDCNGAKIRILSGRRSWTLDLRAYNDGVAYRCELPGKGTHHVAGEAAAWHFPAQTVAWFQTNTVSYEGLYHHVTVRQLGRSGTVHLAMPVTLVFPSGGYGCLSEADEMGYSGMTLAGQPGVFKAEFLDDPHGWTMTGAFATPWRVLMIAPDLNGLVNSTLIANVCPPPDRHLFPDGMRTKWIQPGRCLWQWWAYGDNGTDWSKQKWFVDQAALLHCRYYLVDEGWENPRHGWFGIYNSPWERLKELCAYARTKGVGIWVWKGEPVRPRSYWSGLTTAEARETFFRKCAAAGVVGVKIDFLNSESHHMLSIYRDCLARAAKYKLMLDFHGANKPAGESRTWPNQLTREGIRGLEYNKWSTLPRSHYATLPFVRFVVGPADFTPTTFEPARQKGTTSAQQLALAVVYTSPFLCWADKPEIYLSSPALGLIRTVPTTWDETRVLPCSRIGQLAAYARREGDQWWLGLINGTDHVQTLDLPLNFLSTGAYSCTSVSDVPGKPVEMDVKKTNVQSGQVLHLELQPGGGFVARFVP